MFVNVTHIVTGSSLSPQFTYVFLPFPFVDIPCSGCRLLQRSWRSVTTLRYMFLISSSTINCIIWDNYWSLINWNRSQIKPLVAPTQAIMRARVTNFQWHEFFPRGNALHGYWYKYILLVLTFIDFTCAAKNNIGVVIALWAPIILVNLVMSSMFTRLSILWAVANFDPGSVVL